MLWDAERPVPPDALANLVGQTRAALLLTLDCPRSTTELAATLGMSPGGVSQHLSILREAGLVSGNRLQRVVLYMRSTDGDSLVRASTAQAQRAG
jgi:DNA-binding transcriptional ArsR family regulator